MQLFSNGYLLCGLRGTTTYLSASRPLDTDAFLCDGSPAFCQEQLGKPDGIVAGDICPKGWVVCPGKQSLENRICVEKEQECPINAIEYVKNTFKNKYDENEWKMMLLPDGVNYVAYSRE